MQLYNIKCTKMFEMKYIYLIIEIQILILIILDRMNLIRFLKIYNIIKCYKNYTTFDIFYKVLFFNDRIHVS